MWASTRYVINSEAMKKLYKTMKGRPAEAIEPRDPGREWHSDSQPSCPAVYVFLVQN